MGYLTISVFALSFISFLSPPLLSSFFLCLHTERVVKASSVFWKEPHNIRQFFDAAAREKGFDPLKEDSWYSFDLLWLRKKRVITLLPTPPLPSSCFAEFTGNDAFNTFY